LYFGGSVALFNDTAASPDILLPAIVAHHGQIFKVRNLMSFRRPELIAPSIDAGHSARPLA
jgi:hypothetical protein